MSINNTASAPLICMLRLALSAQLLAGRNRQLGIAPWAALVHRLSLALDSGLAHTAADRYGYRLDAGQDRSCAYLGVRRLDSSGRLVVIPFTCLVNQDPE